MQKIKITIAELEKKTGTKRSTIHHYVRSGLLHEPDKTSQTMAYYDESHKIKLDLIKKIKSNFLKDAKTTRVPLDFIQDKLEEYLPKTKLTSPGPTSIKIKPNIPGSEKKKQIIREALVLYTMHGYRKTTIRDVCKKAGISTPSFYHYFPDKRELFVEAIEYVIEEWREEVAATVGKISDATERGVIMFEIFQKHHPRISEVIDYLATEASTGDPWAANRLKQVFSLLMEGVLKSTRTAIHRGVMRDADPELMAYFFIKINEAATQRLALDNKYSAAEIMSFVADLIAFGLLTPERRKRLTEKQTSR